MRLQGRLRHRRAERREEDRADEDPAQSVAHERQPGGGDAGDEEEQRRISVDEVSVADEATAAVPIERNQGEEEERHAGDRGHERPAPALAATEGGEEQHAEQAEGRVEEEPGVASDEEVEEVRGEARVDLRQAEDPRPGVARSPFLGRLRLVGLGGLDRQLRHLVVALDLDPLALHPEVGRRLAGERDGDAADHRGRDEEPRDPGGHAAPAPLAESDPERGQPEQAEDRLVVGARHDGGTRERGAARLVPDAGEQPAAGREWQRRLGLREREVETDRHRSHAEHLGVQPEDVGEGVRKKEEAGREEERRGVAVELPEVEGAQPDRQHQERHVRGNHAVRAEERHRRRRQEGDQVGLPEVGGLPAVVGHEDEIVRLDVGELVRQAPDVLDLAAQIVVLGERERHQVVGRLVRLQVHRQPRLLQGEREENEEEREPGEGPSDGRGHRPESIRIPASDRPVVSARAAREIASSAMSGRIPETGRGEGT